MKPSGSTLALLALATTIVLWGSAYVAIRIALDGFSVAGLTAGRVVVSGMVLALVAPFVGVRRPARRDLPRLVLCGIVGVTGYQLLLNSGQRTVPAGTTSLLINTAPLFTALLAWLVLRDQLGGRRWAGIAIGFAGAAVMAIGEGDGLRLSGNALLIVIAALCFAGFIILQKPLLGRYSGVEVTCYAMWAGTLVALPFVPALAGDLPSAGVDPTLAVLFLGFATSAIGFATWAYALSRFDVSTTANALYLLPIVAVSSGWLILGERPHPIALVGGVIALTGVMLSRSRPRRARAPRAVDQPA